MRLEFRYFVPILYPVLSRYKRFACFNIQFEKGGSVKMRKSGVFLAFAGLAVLAGCKSEVMDDRKYAPLKDDAGVSQTRRMDDMTSPQAMQSVPQPGPDVAPAPAAPAPAAAPAAAPARPQAPAQARPAFAPMERRDYPAGLVSDGRKTSRKGTAVKGGEKSTYVVKVGDNPGKIARRFNISVKALLEANNMTEKDAKKLYVGRKLVIPAGAKAAPRTSAGSAPAKKGKAAADAPAKGGVYVVQAGDFPERIARRNKVKLSDLLRANNLTVESSRKLKVGQKLVIPGAGGTAVAAAKPKAKKSAAPAAAPAETPAAASAAAPAADNVKKADKLADDLEKNMPEAKNAADEAKNETDLVDITEDISLKALAAKYNTTESKLRSLNDNFSGDTVTKGTIFFVPAQTGK